MNELKTLDDIKRDYEINSDVCDDYDRMYDDLKDAARECINARQIGEEPWLKEYPADDEDIAFILWFFNLEDD